MLQILLLLVTIPPLIYGHGVHTTNVEGRNTSIVDGRAKLFKDKEFTCSVTVHIEAEDFKHWEREADGVSLYLPLDVLVSSIVISVQWNLTIESYFLSRAEAVGGGNVQERTNLLLLEE